MVRSWIPACAGMTVGFAVGGLWEAAVWERRVFCVVMVGIQVLGLRGAVG